MHIVRMREMAKDLGFERLILKQKLLIAHLVSDQQSAFYNSAIFNKLLQAVQIQIVPLEIKETKDKLRLKVQNVRMVAKALEIVEKLWIFCK